MIIFFSPRFRRSYKRLVSKNGQIIDLVKEKIRLFIANPQNPILKDHALKGHLAEYRVISIGYDLRAMYKKTKDTCVFTDIGTHDELY